MVWCTFPKVYMYTHTYTHKHRSNAVRLCVHLLHPCWWFCFTNIRRHTLWVNVVFYCVDYIIIITFTGKLRAPFHTFRGCNTYFTQQMKTDQKIRLRVNNMSRLLLTRNMDHYKTVRYSYSAILCIRGEVLCQL